MSATVTEPNPNDAAAKTAATVVPKRITNAQTVCNERNEKGKLCNGHLKQLRTAGEAADVHLRGDDVLSKCQTCGTLYMGPPLGHVRDPQKQKRFVEAELTALLRAAGGTLPVVKKNEKGVFVIVEPVTEQPATATKPAVTGTAGVSPTPAAPKTVVAATKAVAAKAPAAKQQKLGAAPNRQMFKRSTYVGVVDTGPVAGETFPQKVERLRKVSAAAKQRQEEGGGPTPEAATVAESIAPEATVALPATETVPETVAAPAEGVAAPTPAAVPATTGKADRTLMKRFTYSGVVDTGPVPGETFEQKVERLRAVSAAAKQRSEEGGGAH